MLKKIQVNFDHAQTKQKRYKVELNKAYARETE